MCGMTDKVELTNNLELRDYLKLTGQFGISDKLKLTFNLPIHCYENI